jgi:hypothetical protein
MGGFANNAPIVTDGLVSYVDAGNGNSYSGSGTTWTDLIGGNNGTLNNGPTFDSANGGSIDFDGSDDYATTNYSSLFSDINGGMSINLWIKTTATALQAVLGAFNAGFTVGGRVYINADTTGGAATNTGNIGWWCRDDSANRLSFNADCDVQDGNWHNITITISGTSSSDIKVYNNSSSQTVTIGHSDFDKTDTSLLTNYVWLGAENNRGSVNQPFDGSLACVSFYNKVLSASEVLQNYNALKNRFV